MLTSSNRSAVGPGVALASRGPFESAEPSVLCCTGASRSLVILPVRALACRSTFVAGVGGGRVTSTLPTSLWILYQGWGLGSGFWVLSHGSNLTLVVVSNAPLKTTLPCPVWI